MELAGRGTTWIREIGTEHPGPTLVLLHGWTVTADLNWSAAYEALGHHHHVVALDHRGHGRGIRNNTRFRLEDCAADVAALAESLGLGPIVAVGYSMGGLIAQLLWRDHRAHVAGPSVGRPRKRAITDRSVELTVTDTVQCVGQRLGPVRQIGIGEAADFAAGGPHPGPQ